MTADSLAGYIITAGFAVAIAIGLIRIALSIGKEDK